MFKALFFDIDGTLVSFGKGIPQSALDSLQELHNRGIKIYIATGRPAVLINNLGPMQELGLVDGYITMNGAYCSQADQVLDANPFSRRETEMVVDFCKRNNIPLVSMGNDWIWSAQEDDVVRDVFYNVLKVNPIPRVELDDILNTDQAIYQHTIFSSEEQLSALMDEVGTCDASRWHPTFADVTMKGNTKDKGIDVICEKMGYDLNEIIVFGDGGNDIPMLAHAPNSVAMGNASDKVKAAASYVTSHIDEDGIKNALIHFGLL